MQGKKWIFILSAIAILAVTGGISFQYYSFVFSKTVVGEVIGVERVTQPTAIIGGNAPASQLYSFAIAIRDKNSEIHTASSEDRQWAVVQKGQCAEAKFLPYPPWVLDKSGTFFGARLIRLFDCPGAKTAETITPPPAQPSSEASPSAAAVNPTPAAASSGSPN